MNRFISPTNRRDPADLPPLILTSEAGTFAHHTVQTRLPGILRQTLAQNAFPAAIGAALEALHAELTAGVIRPLCEDAPDVATWQAVSARHFGRSWLDVPWYWAEAYFYRRILEATRYFQPGPWQGVDPFAAIKRREWAPEVAPAAVARLLADLPEELESRFERLLHASLWGNRTDLSYTIAAHLGATAAPSEEQANLLVDDGPAVWRFWETNADGRVDLIADNAGTELLMDIVLIDFLLTSGLASEVRLHLKPQPFYVSDALAADLVAGLDALIAAGGAARRLAQRIDGHVAAGELRVTTHGFYTSSLFYDEMPEDLYDELRTLDLVIIKGDANYRRLVGDRHWPPTTPFAEATGYFPAPVVALRTLKAEVVVGLAPGLAERLQAADPAWLVNGQRGVIQARL